MQLRYLFICCCLLGLSVSCVPAQSSAKDPAYTLSMPAPAGWTPPSAWGPLDSRTEGADSAAPAATEQVAVPEQVAAPATTSAAAAPAAQAAPTQAASPAPIVVATAQNIANPAPARPAMSADMAKAFTQLDDFAKRRLGTICASIRPCIDKKDVVQTGTEFIARYLAVDLDSVDTAITEAQGAGAKYIGSIIYYEQIFESRGATREEALAGEFELVRMRHITELFRYNRGKWID